MDIPPFPVDERRLAALLHAVAEPKRLLILHLIIEGLQCNCQLGEALGVPPNLVSHHLRALRDAGLIEAERDPIDARWIYYSIDPETLDTLNVLFKTFFDPSRLKPRSDTCGPHCSFSGDSEPRPPGSADGPSSAGGRCG